MKKQDMYFEKERVAYIIAVIKDDKLEASLHMGVMLGYKDALSMTDTDFKKICELHDRLMSAIDFAYHMKRRKIRMN